MPDWLGSYRLGLAEHEYLALSVPVQTDKDLDHPVTGDSCLTPQLGDMDMEHQPQKAN